MAAESGSGSGHLGDEALPEQQEFCSDEDEDSPHDFEGSSTSKVAVGFEHPWHTQTAANRNISATDAADAKLANVEQKVLLNILTSFPLDQM